jgi:hypothetical protein
MLYLDKYHGDLAEHSEDLDHIFAVGHRVGAMAQQKYGTDKSVEIPYNKDSKVMLKETADLLAQGVDFPIFEATFEHDGVLIRADIMTLDGDGWHIIEVKSGTSAKDVNKFDAAIQLWVLRGAGLKIVSISLAYIDNQFEYQGDSNYDDLIKKEDVTEEAQEMQDEVAALVKKSRETLAGELPTIPVGYHCDDPYDCAFWSVCWPTDSKFPTPDIHGGRQDIFDWINRGIKDVRDIPADEINNAKRQRIYEVSCSGEADIVGGVKEELESLPYPRYYLDFETTGPAIPIWKGTYPYRQVPVQWSVHIDDGTGDGSLDSMQHREFLNLDGEPPMRELAETLIECLGETGTVFQYTTVEARIIKQLAGMFPDLEGPLVAITERLYDLAKMAREYYCHPEMHGSWSIKDVAPTVSTRVDYSELDEVAEGMAAANFFLEAVHPNTTPERKEDLRKKLLKYCWVDTAAMVEIVAYLSRPAESR